MRFTTNWAGFHRPFFLGVCFYELILEKLLSDRRWSASLLD